MTATADAIVVGGGVIGLACAAAIARAGGRVTLVAVNRPGAASGAAAGMLAPSVEQSDGAAHAFATAARDRYPSYLDDLAEATGVRVPLNRDGILQAALSERGVRGLRRAMPPTSSWLDQPTLAAAEPALAHALGAVLHPDDGAVDNVALLDALERRCRMDAGIRWESSKAMAIDSGRSEVAIRTDGGDRWRGARIVIAAGAWAAQLAGLPRRLPVTPLRGQMLAYGAVPLTRVVFGPRGYVVPRAAQPMAPAETLVGATSELVDFDSGTTPAAARSLHAAGSEIVPALAAAGPTRQWAGLRPMTPDLLPVLGPDPENGRVIYACGHSRNGILMAALTGDCVAALVLGAEPPHDLTPFRIDRFADPGGERILLPAH